MAKDPAFLFYSQDFYTGVSTLNFEDRGKYISILCIMHQKGRLDEKTIWLLVGSVSVSLKSKFSIDENGFWYNSRLEMEVEKRRKYSESRRNNGLQGGRPPKKTEKAYGYRMLNHMEDVNENENKEKKGGMGEKKEKAEKVKSPKKKSEFVPPIESEVVEYFKSNGYTEQSAHTAFRYYSEANWVDSKGSRVLNWKQKMIAVWFKPENQQGGSEKKQFADKTIHPRFNP